MHPVAAHGQRVQRTTPAAQGQIAPRLDQLELRGKPPVQKHRLPRLSRLSEFDPFARRGSQMQKAHHAPAVRGKIVKLEHADGPRGPVLAGLLHGMTDQGDGLPRLEPDLETQGLQPAAGDSQLMVARREPSQGAHIAGLHFRSMTPWQTIQLDLQSTLPPAKGMHQADSRVVFGMQ